MGDLLKPFFIRVGRVVKVVRVKRVVRVIRGAEVMGRSIVKKGEVGNWFIFSWIF